MSLEFLTAGESHGKCLTGIIDGLPAGLKLDVDKINHELARRQKGFGRGGRMKIETDTVEILSGVRFGETLGSPITLCVKNRDWENWEKRMATFGEPFGPKVTAARPGHADLVGVKKFSREDVRDILERSSARETAMRVAIGAVCRQFLEACGIKIASQVCAIGGIFADEKIMMEARQEKIFTQENELNFYDEEKIDALKEKILMAKDMGDTFGGIFEICVRGACVGLGSHVQWKKRLDGKLAQALMSIQAIKGVEIGEGFRYASLFGSESHDEIFFDGEKIFRKTNHAGGLEGGMTNGEDILLRAVMKPIPTLMKPLRSIDIQTKEAILASKERSDVCAVSAASFVGEAMTAITLANEVLEKFGDGALCDVLQNLKAYQERVSQ